MNLKDIFRMEMYKNCTDKPYIIMIAALTVSAAISTFFYDIINLADNYDNLATSLLIIAWGLLLVFTIIGIAVFVYLYPFHLLRVDYKNKVMSLMFASGVSRTHYYFVKIGATILTCLAAAMIILFVPLVTLLVFRQNLFVDFIRFVFDMFQNEDILSLFLYCIVALIASLVTLSTAVIVTKGSIVSIFLFIAFSSGVSIFSTIISATVLALFDTSLEFDMQMSTYFFASTLGSVLQIIVFAAIGMSVLKKQNL